MNTLKKLRLDCKLKLKDVAESVGLSTQGLSNYENNLRTPPVDIAHKLAVFYSVSVETLFPLFPDESKFISNEFIGNSDREDFTNKLIKLHIYSKLRTGKSASEGEVLESVDYYYSEDRDSSFFGLRIKGSYLSPDFLDNDLLIFEKYSKETAFSNNSFSIIVASIKGGGTSIFKYLKVADQYFISEFGIGNFINAEKDVLVEILGVLKQIRRNY